MALEMLIREAKGMSDDALIQVVHFMRFLKLESIRSRDESSDVRLRKAGKRKGQIVMAEDFDVPLEDFYDVNTFWE